jgi:hypothetical protein
MPMPPAAAAPRVLIRDDGELDDVRALLTQMGVDYAETTSRGAAELPVDLLVSSPRPMMSALNESSDSPKHLDCLHIVVVDEASRALHRMLKGRGCDLLLRRPVHPTALRLLVQRALYEGEEKRQSERVAIGAPVKIRKGLLWHGATLAELSMHGCGLVSSQGHRVGDALKVTLGRRLTGTQPLSLDSRIVGVLRQLPAESGKHSIAAAFSRLDAPTRRLLRSIMTAHSVGSTVETKPRKRKAPAPSEPSPGATTAPDGTDRRSSERRPYSRSVLAKAEGQACAIIGRDLSAGGMRVEREPSLALGMELRLALYGHANLPPLLVRTVVHRDDGEEGWALRFEDLSEPAREQIQQLVESLPVVDSDGDPIHSRPGQVVSEVLERS